MAERDEGWVAVVGEGPALSALRSAGYEPVVLNAADDKHLASVRNQPRVVILDGADPAVIERGIMQVHRSAPLTDVIVWAPRASSTRVREILRAGARDVALSDDASELRDGLQRVLKAQVLLPKMRELSARRAKGSRFDSLLS